MIEIEESQRESSGKYRLSDLAAEYGPLGETYYDHFADAPEGIASAYQAVGQLLLVAGICDDACPQRIEDQAIDLLNMLAYPESPVPEYPWDFVTGAPIVAAARDLIEEALAKHPGEELRCEKMIVLKRAVESTGFSFVCFGEDGRSVTALHRG